MGAGEWKEDLPRNNRPYELMFDWIRSTILAIVATFNHAKRRRKPPEKTRSRHDSGVGSSRKKERKKEIKNEGKKERKKRKQASRESGPRCGGGLQGATRHPSRL